MLGEVFWPCSSWRLGGARGLHDWVEPLLLEFPQDALSPHEMCDRDNCQDPSSPCGGLGWQRRIPTRVSACYSGKAEVNIANLWACKNAVLPLGPGAACLVCKHDAQPWE